MLSYTRFDIASFSGAFATLSLSNPLREFAPKEHRLAKQTVTLPGANQ